jgi:hypothetical protein
MLSRTITSTKGLFSALKDHMSKGMFIFQAWVDKELHMSIHEGFGEKKNIPKAQLKCHCFKKIKCTSIIFTPFSTFPFILPHPTVPSSKMISI